MHGQNRSCIHGILGRRQHPISHWTSSKTVSICVRSRPINSYPALEYSILKKARMGAFDKGHLPMRKGYRREFKCFLLQRTLYSIHPARATKTGMSYGSKHITTSTTTRCPPIVRLIEDRLMIPFALHSPREIGRASTTNSPHPPVPELRLSTRAQARETQACPKLE